ncbi:MAG: organic solvent tolerance protein OstA [Planctomycetota bacterium]
MERSPIDDLQYTYHPPPWDRRNSNPWVVRMRGDACASLHFLARWCAALAILVGLVVRASGSEIGVPLSDPKHSIAVFANKGTRHERGDVSVYVLEEGCRIYQGRFYAQADRATLWVKTFEVDGEAMQQVTLELAGSCQVRWAEDQRMEDSRWLGRLFSRFEVEVSAEAWMDGSGTPPAMPASSDDRPESDSVQPAVAWTAADESNYLRLAAQLRMAQQPAIPIPSTSMPAGLPPAGSFPASPSLGTMPPAGNATGSPSPLANQMILGNQQVGGTVLEGGTMPLPQPPAPLVLSNGPAPLPAPVAQSATAVRTAAPRMGAKEFLFVGRGGVEPQLQITPRPDRGDTVVTITRGIRLMFSDVAVQTSGGLFDMGTVLIECDRCVIWTSDMNRLLSRRIDDLPVELYLEGNIVFQQGSRKIYADRMYYNVQSEYGMILGAEVLTPAPGYEGIVRLKADVIQQRSRENFLASGAAMTSSRLGGPRYWLQADRIEMNDQRQSSGTGMLGFGLLAQDSNQTRMKAQARHNFVYLEGVPVLYWPVLNTNVDTSSYYVSGFQYRQDQILGAQAMVDWNLYQILGINAVDGTKWNLSTDYLSKRGFALGSDFNYSVPGFLHSGPAQGTVDAWGLNDRGLDTLGSDRVGLIPESLNRGRVIWNHRQMLNPTSELWAELGWLSDRNFLEQYYESDWDTLKDRSTALRYRNYFKESQMLDIWGQARINEFFTETQWLPRLDHYVLGCSLGDLFTWYSHSHVGYADQKVASFPTSPQDASKWIYQPWEVPASGIQTATRQEIAMPFQFFYAKWTPYLSGEAAYWGEDLNGDPLTRLTGQAGLRTSTPFWQVFPDVQSTLFNINGLAHKVNYTSETWYAGSDRDLDQLPLYDPIDDNAQEHFRRRLIVNTFGGTLPAQFESRDYAARQGLQRYVSAVSPQIVADQMQSRIGLQQRLQTKRGTPGRERIADLVEFDVDGIFFYNPDRDNFGQSVGGINYDFRYHIGDRFTIVSDGYYDLFDRGLRATSIGTILSRPRRGELYVGYTNLSGPVSSQILNTNFNYRLNDKWAANGGTAIDFGPTGNTGQSLGVTRIGESFLLRLALAYDQGRDNVSFQFALEPRFFQTGGLGVVAGQVIPPAGAYGLE